MNCKPNDMAVVFRNTDGTTGVPPEFVGAIVKVIELVSPGMWLLAEPVMRVMETHVHLTCDGMEYCCKVGDPVSFGNLPDSLLQPIRGVPAPTAVVRETEVSV